MRPPLVSNRGDYQSRRMRCRGAPGRAREYHKARSAPRAWPSSLQRDGAGTGVRTVEHRRDRHMLSCLAECPSTRTRRYHHYCRASSGGAGHRIPANHSIRSCRRAAPSVSPREWRASSASVSLASAAASTPLALNPLSDLTHDKRSMRMGAGKLPPGPQGRGAFDEGDTFELSDGALAHPSPPLLSSPPLSPFPL